MLRILLERCYGAGRLCEMVADCFPRTDLVVERLPTVGSGGHLARQRRIRKTFLGCVLGH